MKQNSKQPDLHDGPAWEAWFTDRVMSTIRRSTARYYEEIEARRHRKAVKEVAAAHGMTIEELEQIIGEKDE